MRVTGLDSQYSKHDSSRDATYEYTVRCLLVVAEAMVLVVLRRRFVLPPLCLCTFQSGRPNELAGGSTLVNGLAVQL